MTLALALTGVVFLVLSIALAFAAGHNTDHYNRKAAKNFQLAAWTSLGLSATLFLVAIWHQALTTGG